MGCKSNTCRALVLPQELSDLILAYLQHDKESLKHCGLVCKSWFFSTRTYLFHQLTFTPTNTVGLAQLLNGSPRPTFPPYVKRLKFCGSQTLFQNSSIILSTILLPFCTTAAVTHIHLSNVVLDTFDCLLDIICQFTCLDSISLEHVNWKAPLPPGTYAKQQNTRNKCLPYSTATALVQLRLKHLEKLSDFVQWLLSHPDGLLPMIPDLEIGPIEEQHIHSVGQYLALIGPVVKHLNLSFGYGEISHICGTAVYRDMNEILRKFETGCNKPKPEKSVVSATQYLYWKWFGLSVCSRFGGLKAIETLKIDKFIDSSAPHQITATFWAPRVLASIYPRYIRQITLGIIVSRAGNLDNYGVNWEFIDKILTAENYTNLRLVRFEINNRVGLDGVSSLLSMRLPLSTRKGIIEICRAA